MICTATKQVCNALGGDRFPELRSPSLRLEKFAWIGHARKKDEIDAVVKCHNAHAFSARAFLPPTAKSLVMQLAGRLIINQAGGILENAGLCLHHHFGYPVIPGSAVKGCARHAAWERWNEAEDAAEKRCLARKIALTFGYPTGDSKNLDFHLVEDEPELFGEKGPLKIVAGSIVFLAAVPQGRAQLVIDIVNCHHMEYYGGKRDHATDDESPNPQFFPAVEAGASFVFSLLPVGRRTETVKKTYGFDPLEFALDVLREGLEGQGIGAKTAAGYGWFEDDEQARITFTRKKQEEEEARRERERALRRERELAAMSPEDRRVEELGQLSRDAFIADCINPIAGKDAAEQRLILRALLEKHPDIWASDRTAKPKKKAGKRADAIREVAAQLGVNLP